MCQHSVCDLQGRQLTYINSDKDADTIVLPPCVPLVIKLLGCVVTDHQGVLGKLLVEALLGSAIEVEVERLSDLNQRAQAQDRKDASHAVGCAVGYALVSS